jgi:hypothetical protein
MGADLSTTENASSSDQGDKATGNSAATSIKPGSSANKALEAEELRSRDMALRERSNSIPEDDDSLHGAAALRLLDNTDLTSAAFTHGRKSPNKGRGFVRRPSWMWKSSQPKSDTAQVIFYDDYECNFEGVFQRGTVPAIRCKHCNVPITTAQLRRELATWKENAAAEVDHYDMPRLFYAFDFDGTLSMHAGLKKQELMNAADADDFLSTMFGERERQVAMVELFIPLLAAHRCYVVTANEGYRAITILLNLLIKRHAPSAKKAEFVFDETVRFALSGTKISAINSIAEQRGFKLVSTF